MFALILKLYFKLSLWLLSISRLCRGSHYDRTALGVFIYRSLCCKRRVLQLNVAGKIRNPSSLQNSEAGAVLLLGSLTPTWSHRRRGSVCNRTSWSVGFLSSTSSSSFLRRACMNWSLVLFIPPGLKRTFSPLSQSSAHLMSSPDLHSVCCTPPHQTIKFVVLDKSECNCA